MMDLRRLRAVRVSGPIGVRHCVRDKNWAVEILCPRLRVRGGALDRERVDRTDEKARNTGLFHVRYSCSILYCEICSRSFATSLAVRLAPLAPKRAVT
jgi:hypothetical protein